MKKENLNMTIVCNIGTRFHGAFDDVPLIIATVQKYTKESWNVAIHLEGTYFGLAYKQLS